MFEKYVRYSLVCLIRGLLQAAFITQMLIRPNM